MNSKLLTLAAAGALMLSTAAYAQQSGASSNENDRSGQPTDSSATSAQPQRPAGTQGQGGATSGTAGQGSQQDPAMGNREPLQPGGISPSAPPQGATGHESNPRPR